MDQGSPIWKSELYGGICAEDIAIYEAFGTPGTLMKEETFEILLMAFKFFYSDANKKTRGVFRERSGQASREIRILHTFEQFTEKVM